AGGGELRGRLIFQNREDLRSRLLSAGASQVTRLAAGAAGPALSRRVVGRLAAAMEEAACRCHVACRPMRPRLYMAYVDPPLRAPVLLLLPEGSRRALREFDPVRDAPSRRRRKNSRRARGALAYEEDARARGRRTCRRRGERHRRVSRAPLPRP